MITAAEARAKTLSNICMDTESGVAKTLKVIDEAVADAVANRKYRVHVKPDRSLAPFREAVVHHLLKLEYKAVFFYRPMCRNYPQGAFYYELSWK